jgi:hypothetical protein
MNIGESKSEYHPPDLSSAMQCNIDKRGQIARFWGGLLFIVAGIALGMLTSFTTWPAWLYLLAALLTASGAFMLFEARTKWCAARAMGFRTPI